MTTTTKLVSGQKYYVDAWNKIQNGEDATKVLKSVYNHDNSKEIEKAHRAIRFYSESISLYVSMHDNKQALSLLKEAATSDFTRS